MEDTMALRIRLSRGGNKKRPFYRIVVAEAASRRDGKFLERVGAYNPMLPQGHSDRVVLATERVQHWLSVGALPTDRVEKFLANANLVAAPVRQDDPKQSAPRKKTQERMRVAAELAAKAEAAAAKAAEEAAAAKLAAEAAEKEAAAAPAPEAEAPAVEAADETEENVNQS
jgi:small subunit ribosomal protein S16